MWAAALLACLTITVAVPSPPLAHEASRRGLHGVVCGHIHRAEMREIEGVLYCNTGDWVESCTALAEATDGTLELLSMAPAARESVVARVALT